MTTIAGSPRRWLTRAVVLSVGIALMSGCQSHSSSTHGGDELAPEDDAPIFSSSIFGVKASPRVTRLKRVPKGGGRDQTGQPYKVRGKWYYPKEEPGYVKTGDASWYGANFHGRLTANGEVYDMYHLSAAHPTFPLPSYARVTNRKTGASVMVRVNDRGPYMHDRVMDVSSKAAEMLGFQHDGIGDVKVEYVGRAPLEGDDTRMLMASYRPGSARSIDDGLPTGVMIASNTPRSVPTLIASAFSPPKFSVPTPTVSRPVAPAKPAVAPAATSVEDLIRTFDTSGPATADAAPVPTPRGLALSYASSVTRSGATSAIGRLVAVADEKGAEARPVQRIELGLLPDAVRTRIARLAREVGARMIDEGDGVAALDLAEGTSVDPLLRRVWDAGAGEAFALRDD